MNPDEIRKEKKIVNKKQFEKINNHQIQVKSSKLVSRVMQIK
jgi:hypothetical protein